MAFASPWFLLALALAAIPVVLYLLFRMRKRNVDWGASYILRLTLSQSVKESRWRQYVVLGVRTLGLAAVAAAFAVPLLALKKPPGAEFPRGGSGALTRVILLDNSLSMGAQYGSGTRFSEARRIAVLLLEGMSGGDSFVVIPLCGDEKLPEFQPPCKAAQIESCLSKVALGAGRPDVAAGLERAYRQFLSTRTPNRQLIVLGDFSAADFPEPDALRPFADSLRELGVATYFHTVAEPGDSNLALLGATFGTDYPLAGQTYNLYVDVANYGPQPRVGDRLSLLEGAEVLQFKDYDLVPNERKTLQVPITLAAGEHALELRTSEDLFPADNYLSLAVSVRESLPVMLVAPAADEQAGFESEGEFLRRALQGAADAGGGKGLPVRLTIKNPTTLTAESLAAVRVVVMAGAAIENPEAADALKRYLRRGGGLILGLSPKVNAEACRPRVKELFGAELLTPFAEQTDYDRYRFIQRANLRDPLLTEFGTDLNTDITRARVYNHIRTRVPQGAGAAEVLLRLSNGDPLLVRARCGRGVALLWTTTLGGQWSSLVVRQTFVPLLSRLLDMAACGAAPPKNLAPGEPVISRAEGAGALYMVAPGRPPVALKRIRVGDQQYVRFDDTSAAGLYTLADESGKALLEFTVTARQAESDLRPLGDKDRQALEGTFGTRFTHGEDELRSAMLTAGYGFDLTTLVVAALGLLLLLESLLLRTWFY